ncbi:MAG: PadR family transcriptional regulator, partial [Thermoplasmata archaeon]|nr:PadR family transcriptional regulator [Thermoplasmata archaeon]
FFTIHSIILSIIPIPSFMEKLKEEFYKIILKLMVSAIKITTKHIYRLRYIDFDMKTILKIFILKQLMKEEMSGYDIMKRCEEVLGYKPSPGTIYPLLKSMERKKIIEGKREGRRIVYKLLPKGRKFMKEIMMAREEFYRKLHSQMAAMEEIFGGEITIGWKEKIIKKYPLLPKIIFILERMGSKRANEMLEEFYRRLKNASN